VLYAAFKVADDQGLLLLDLKDLRSLLAWVSDNAASLRAQYGNLSGASVAAIQRQLLVLEQDGAGQFFGEPALDLADLMRTDFSGQGVVSVLDASALMPRPRLYATFLLWLLAELFERLPEVGDVDRPRLVFFFDEAHLLFDTAPRALLEKIEQVVRLIRSKGVGVFFVTQNPQDIPDAVLGQLGNRMQHALRAFTPRDRAAVRVAAQNFRANPGLDVETVITELGVGEALVSVLDARGQPTPVERTLIRPPASRLGPLTAQERTEHLTRSPLAGRYDTPVDRESAYELLAARAAAVSSERAGRARARSGEPAQEPAPQRRGREPDTLLEATAKSALRAIGSQLGRQLVRGVLGSLLGGRR
jgi:DNA helicase HerA-like ATPase